MKIVFLSNYFNHHQESFCDEMYRRLGEDFNFVSTSVMSKERRKLGYGSNLDREYILLAYDDEENIKMVKEKIDSADIVITGSAPEVFLENRKKDKKIIIRYSERPLKKGMSIWKYPVRWYKWHKNNPKNTPIYMLCASAYTAADYAKFGLFKNRTLKWGYFPECKKYKSASDLTAQKNVKEILWCGRFLDWKHPDDVLTVAKRLKEEEFDFHINIIGTGEMEPVLKETVLNGDLSDVVTFLGSMSPVEVRKHMEQTGIYLFTSDRNEGWGAVLNEAMNSGCAVVASHSIGSVPYLIDNDKNGLIYESGNIDMLLEKVKHLLGNPSEQRRLGTEAYKTIKNEWNAENAAARICSIAEKLMKGEKTVSFFEYGPCSKAEIISEEY